MRRRTIVMSALVGLPAVAAAGGAGAVGLWWANAELNTAGRIDFVNRLAIPPLARSRTDGRGHRVFDLVATAGGHRFRAGRPTAVWGFDGGYLGPTLRAIRGETVQVNVRNDLPEPTSVHWHGMHLPAAMDGGPHQVVPSGATWSPAWRVDQPAATLWYHPHPHQRTARQVYRGMAGLFLLDDPRAAPAGLPNRYGVDDVPVLIQDKRIGGDNQLDESEGLFSTVGLLGDRVCVNGTLAPYHDVTTQRVRLRLLNASNARIYRLGLADNRTFALIGTDGGLLATPHQITRVQLSPGERAEIVVTFQPGERAVLRSYPPDLGTNGWITRVSGGHDTLDVLELRAAALLDESPPLPVDLAAPPRLDAAPVAATRRFTLSGSTINGQSMDMHRIDFAAAVNTVEHWEVINHDGVPHNFHIHDVQFQILTVNNAPPPPELSGWKDTIYTPPGPKFRLALRFADHTDPNTPYMYHCHLLQHEDHGLMGQFVVVQNGQSPTPPQNHDHS